MNSNHAEAIRNIMEELSSSLGDLEELSETLDMEAENSPPVQVTMNESIDGDYVYVDLVFEDNVLYKMMEQIVDHCVGHDEWMEKFFIEGLHYYIPGSVILQSIPYLWSKTVDLLSFPKFHSAWLKAELRVNADLIKDGLIEGPENAVR